MRRLWRWVLFRLRLRPTDWRVSFVAARPGEWAEWRTCVAARPAATEADVAAAFAAADAEIVRRTARLLGRAG